MTWTREFQSSLIEEGKKLDLVFSDLMVKQLTDYGALLVEWNQKMNLTGITDPKEVALKHMIDSAIGAQWMPRGAKVIDVGTGAGFPGLVLKIVRPDLEVVLLDSLNKRLRFLSVVIETLELERISVIHSRAEDGAHQKELRESFDIAVSRAVASLPILAEYCFPFVKLGGEFLAWKGPKGQGEVLESENAFKILGGKLKKVEAISLPGADEPRLMIRVEKIKKTDLKYPRKPGADPL